MTGRNSEPYRRRWRDATLAACLILAVTGSRAAAADDEQQVPVQPPVAAPVTSSADFLFGAPRAWIAIRGSVLFPRAGGDLFTFVNDELTVDKSDLRSGGFGADVIVGYYSFAQRGQFVDYADLSVFNDRFMSDGWSVGPYLQGGADVQVWKHLFVTFDGRYTWMHAGLDPDFVGFDGIDLAGFRGGTGISVVF